MERHTRRTFVLGATASIALAATPSIVRARVAAKCGGCTATEADIEGPYYRAGAPLRSDLTTAGLDGERLVLRGVVRGPDCEMLSGALLDVWQADAAGHYDNDGSGAHPASELVLRGRVRTDASGAFQLRTIVPGRYLNGRTYRPAHIHVKVAAAGRAPLTTQLYFPGDPYNEGDPFFSARRLVREERDRGDRVALFDFTLG